MDQSWWIAYGRPRVPWFRFVGRWRARLELATIEDLQAYHATEQVFYFFSNFD
jgi:hypothetical protein